jgi:hypothetical protein
MMSCERSGIMRQEIAILFGGYAFIALSCVWTWSIGAAMLRSMSLRRKARPTRTDLRTLLGILAGWTVMCLALPILDAWI